MIDLSTKRILVTGGDGFVGHHLLPLLKQKCQSVFAPTRLEYNLLLRSRVSEMYIDYRPDIVIHLAARVGGIQFNQANPAKLFYENLQMGMNLIDCGQGRFDKFVCLGTVCSYPKIPPHIPFGENDLWEGYPEGTNAPYGIAKKALLTMCQAYRQQYGMNCIYLMPTNLYGEFDTFTDEQGHVIPMLIKRFLQAQENNLPEVVVWGSGKATREFLYAGDAAKVIVRATEVYDKPEPLNIGSGQETSIAELAKTIADIVGYKGGIVWDKTKPDGQPRRLLDINRMEFNLNINSLTMVSLKSGLERTIKWYKENRR